MSDAIFKKYFPDLELEKLEKLEALQAHYKEWNDKINVISRKDVDNLNSRHVLHSLAIAKFINFKDETRIMDLGTGGGFPGIPLAILYPKCTFNLVDSRGKKLTVIEDIAAKIGLDNIITTHDRAENIKTKYHFVVCRAVASLEKLLSWGNKLISSKQLNVYPNGFLCLKGGDLKDELKALPKFYDPEVIDIKNFYDDPFYEHKHIIYIPV